MFILKKIIKHKNKKIKIKSGLSVFRNSKFQT
jgi:hypothetical protein